MFMKRNRWMIVLLGLGALLGLVFLAWQFTTQFETRLFALDVETGHVKWSRSVRTDWTFTPASGNGRVFAYALVPLTAQEREASGTQRKNTVKLCAFDLQSGAFQFSIQAKSRQLQAAGDTLYINAETSLLAVDAATGVPRWIFSVPASDRRPFLFGLQTVGQDTYIIHFFQGQDDGFNAWLLALNAADGHELWQRQLAQELAISRSDIRDQFFDTLPATNQDAFFAHLEDENQNSAVRAFSAVDGSELWHFPLYQRGIFDVMASPTTQDKLVFVTDWAPRWRNWLKSLNLGQNN